MSLKQINKSELTYDQGYFMLGGDVVAMTPAVTGQIILIDNMMTEAKTLAEEIAKLDAARQPGATAPKPKPGKFDFRVEAKTPLIDAQEAEHKALMEELNNKTVADIVNAELESYGELAFFVNSGKVFISDDITPQPLHLRTIENPLELDSEAVIKAVSDCTSLKRELNAKRFWACDTLPGKYAVGIPGISVHNVDEDGDASEF